MTNTSGRLMRLFGVAALALIILVPGTMTAQSLMTNDNVRSASPNIFSGVVQSMNRSLNYITVRDDATGRDVKIDVRAMNTAHSINVWQLRPGDRITVNGGWTNSETFRADRVNFGAYDPMASVATGNAFAGTVEKVNRNLKFITVRDQNTGRKVKVDIRRMDTRQSVNVWQLRSGDPVVVNGGWTNKNTFQANRVNVASTYQPMTSAYGSSNFVNGIVQDVNRDLNYVTVRDEATGQSVKIDVRRMDTRRSVNVWNLRAGDRIGVNGTWENHDTFQAETVNF